MNQTKQFIQIVLKLSNAFQFKTGFSVEDDSFRFQRFWFHKLCGIGIFVEIGLIEQESHPNRLNWN